jgi:mono/diheme cytochrome c family protein
MAPPSKPEPGRDAGMAVRARKLNVLFALTSIGMLVAFSLMIWDDYDREWKQYQKNFNRLEVKTTKEQAEQALGKMDASRREALQQELAKGKQEAEARRSDIAKAESEAGTLQGRWYGVDQDYRFTKAEIDVARYEYEEAVQKKKANADAKGKRLRDLEQRWEQLRLRLQEIEGEQAAVKARIADLEKTKLAAEAQQKEAFAEYNRLNERLQKIQPGVVSFVRNMPLLDLANPSLKVNQIMPANLTDDVIFTGTPKVDRCTTCHLGIDKKGYENAPQPFTTHPNLETFLQGPHPMERVGCTACHGGRGRGTTFFTAVHTPSTAEQEKAWAKYSGGGKEYHRFHFWDSPMVAKGNTEANCIKCHQGSVEVPRAASLNSGRMLIERYGCYGCHKIKGWEDLRKVGPDLSKILAKTNEDWVYRWIKEPKGFRPTRMPQVWDVRTPDQDTAPMKVRNDVEANAVVAYLAEKSGRDTYPEPPAGDLAAGRAAFESIGCLGCHRVGSDRRGIDATLKDGTTKKGFDAASYRTHGPNLDGTGSKVSAGWLYSWIQNPKGYWHETRMPSLRLSAKEAADITAYLMSLKNDDFMARPRPGIDPAVRDAIIKEHLVAANTPVRDADKQLAAMDDHQRTLFVGEKTIGRYGCFGCHSIPGFEKSSPIGVELTEEGSKLVERLDFGYEHGRIPHTLPAWVHLKVMEPRIYDRGKVKRPEEMLRMPKFWVQEDEAAAIVTAVMSLTKDQTPLAAQKAASADDRHVQQGARLVRDLNCRGCHVIGDQGGSIQAVVSSQLEASGVDSLTARSQTVAFSPPILYNEDAKVGEGARVQTDWLHGFLLDPSNEIRPWVTLRMPTFEFTPEQLNVVTRYFASMDKVPFPYDPKPHPDPQKIAAGKQLFDNWQCVKCHVVAGKLPNQPPENMAPDLAKVPERLRADWLRQWFKDPGKIQPGTRMPAVFPDKAEENAYPEILGGDQAAQIDAVTQYLMTLGQPVRAGAPADPGRSQAAAGTRAGGGTR